MATGSEVLKYYEITVEQANGFIMANVNQPELIYDTARELGISTQHLSDITGYSTSIIKDYFESSGLDIYFLDQVRILFNSNLEDLDYLVDFDDKTGVLSTTSLEERVKASVDSSVYEDFFKSTFDYQAIDGNYSPDELGTNHVGNVPAQNTVIENLFYSTLVNQYMALDGLEVDQIIDFKLTNDNFDEYREMLHDALVDVPSTPYWDDEILAESIYKEAVNIINGHEDSVFIGKLDSTFLGLAIA